MNVETNLTTTETSTSPLTNQSSERPATVTLVSDALKGLDILSPDRTWLYNAMLSALRMEPFFKALPATPDENKQLYGEVRRLLQDFIHEGSLALYQDGNKIHQQRPGEMQIVLAGRLQMTGNRYTNRDDLLKQVEMRGPEYRRGESLASWSMAGATGAHFATISAVGAALTFCFSGSQYARLIRATLSHHSITREDATLGNEEVETLVSAGMINCYDKGEPALFHIARERDLKKKIEKIDPEAQSHVSDIWRRHGLDQSDFLIRTANGDWCTVKHVIQSKIKDLTVTQHVLQQNFLRPTTDQVSPDCLAPASAFKEALSNSEFRSLARATARVRDLSGEFPATHSMYLVTHADSDVERPNKPLNHHSLEAGDATYSVTYSDEIEGEKRTRSIELQIPNHGVIDPKEILFNLRQKFALSEHAHIESLHLSFGDNLHLYQVDLGAYYDEVKSSYKFSFERVVKDLINLGLEVLPSQIPELTRRFETIVTRAEQQSLEHSEVSLRTRRELIKLCDAWVRREAGDRKGPRSVEFSEEKANDLFGLLEEAIPWLTPHLNSQELASSAVIAIEPSKRDATKRTLILLQHFLPDALTQIPQDVYAKIYHRDRKFAQFYRLDEHMRDLYLEGKELHLIEEADVGWAKHHRREIIVVPDRHEDQWGLQADLHALGVINQKGEMCSEALKGKTLIYAGDVCNRQIGPLGLSSLQLVSRVIEEAELYNQQHPGGIDGEHIQAKMLLGNHELDLLKIPEDLLAAHFPDFSDYILARLARETLKNMIQKGHVVAAYLLGDSDSQRDETHRCIATHSMFLPQFRREIDILLEGMGREATDREFVAYCNEVLRSAAMSGDFSHILFNKSGGRGGGSSFSGPIETDMGPGSDSDFNRYIAELLQAEKSRDDAIARAEGETKRQLSGHSFCDSQPAIRTVVSADGKISMKGLIIADPGDHQNPDVPPEVAVRMLVIPVAEDGTEPRAYSMAYRFTEGPPRIQSEEEVGVALDPSTAADPNSYRARLEAWLGARASQRSASASPSPSQGVSNS